MTLSMHQVAIPPVIHSLGNLVHILRVAAEHATSRTIDEQILLNSRLFPDMFPLIRQVQIASDIARRGMCRLAGIEPASVEDNETSFQELIARLEATIDGLRGVGEHQLEGSESLPIELPVRGETLHFDGRTFLLYFILPNLYFHVTTTYDILRHNGVELGKRDFLGDPR